MRLLDQNLKGRSVFDQQLQDSGAEHVSESVHHCLLFTVTDIKLSL